MQIHCPLSQCHRAVLGVAAVAPLFSILGRGAWSSFLSLLPLSEELMSPLAPSHSDVICEGCSQQRAGKRHYSCRMDSAPPELLILRFCLLGPVLCLSSSSNYDFRNIFLKTYLKVLRSTHPQYVRVCACTHACIHKHHTHTYTHPTQIYVSLSTKILHCGGKVDIFSISYIILKNALYYNVNINSTVLQVALF